MRSGTERNMRTRALLLSLLLILVPAALAQTTGIGPDAAGYTATSATPFSFINIVSTGTAVLAGADEDAAVLDLGFSFYFYGHAYTSVCVSTNGLMSFGGCNKDFANQDLTAVATTGNYPAIAPFWMDLTFSAPGAGAVYYQTLGTGTGRMFVVQWTNAFPVNGTKGFTFQAVLSETSNNILFQYQSIDAGSGSPASLGAMATVGIRDTDGQANNRRLQWSHAAPVLTNNEAILFSSSVSANFSLAVTSPTQPVPAGDPATFTVTLNPAGGFLAPVTLACTGLPAGASCSFSPNPISTGTSTLTLSLPVTTPGGSISFQVTGTSGTVVRDASGALTVTARPGSISASSIVGVPGTTVAVPVSVSMIGAASFDTVLFGVRVTPNGSAPALDTAIDFQPGTGLPVPGLKDLNDTLDTMSVAWLSPVSPVISGNFTLGKVLVKIPASAQNAQTYTVRIISVSAATGSTPISLALGAPATLTVTSYTYLVGDVFPVPSAHGDLNGDGKYDDAGEFGDDSLNILDLIIALRAVTGVAPLTPCSDRFDAADSYPMDTDTVRGGDGKLTILDLIITLRRVTGVNTVRPRRVHATGCVATSAVPGGPVAGRVSPSRAARPQASAARGQVRVELGRPEAGAAGVYRAPVYVYADAPLSGLALSIRSEAQQAFTFVADGAAGSPSLVDDSVDGAVSVAWLDKLSVSAGRRVLLGHVRVRATERGRRTPSLVLGAGSALSMDGQELSVTANSGAQAR